MRQRFSGAGAGSLRAGVIRQASRTMGQLLAFGNTSDFGAAAEGSAEADDEPRGGQSDANPFAPVRRIVSRESPGKTLFDINACML